MTYELSTTTIMWFHNLLLFLALFFAVNNLHNFMKIKIKKNIIRIKKIVFTWLTAGIAFMFIAFLLNNIYLAVGIYKSPSSIDLFFVLSYICLAAAFGYFWFATHKLHKLHIKEPVFIFGVICGVFIWLYYLFTNIIIPGSIFESATVQFLNYFYPIMISTIFILTLIIKPRLESGIIHTPLWYISNAIFMYFFAFMIYAYSLWNTHIIILPIIYAVLFFLSSGYFLLGFYTATQKYH